jgi:hypothetical protein
MEAVMTFDELMVDQRLQTFRRPVTAHEALVLEAMTQQPGLRASLASGLVRLGAWLDRGALEDVAVSTGRNAKPLVRDDDHAWVL